MLPLRIFHTQYVTYLQLKIEYSGHYHSEALFKSKPTYYLQVYQQPPRLVVVA